VYVPYVHFGLARITLAWLGRSREVTLSLVAKPDQQHHHTVSSPPSTIISYRRSQNNSTIQ
jgi:hypothetical protein